MNKLTVRRLKQTAVAVFVAAPCMLGAGFGFVWLWEAVQARLQIRLPGFLGLVLLGGAMWGTFWLICGRLIQEVKAEHEAKKARRSTD